LPIAGAQHWRPATSRPGCEASASGAQGAFREGAEYHQQDAVWEAELGDFFFADINENWCMRMLVFWDVFGLFWMLWFYDVLFITR